MTRLSLRYSLVLLGVLTAFVVSGTATATAAGRVHLSTSVEGDTIHYSVTDVPSSGTIIVVPGTCVTVVANTARALPILAPLLIDYGSGNAIDIGNVLRQILEREVIAGQDIRIANRSNQILDRSFAHLPRGLYVVVTVCGTAADIARLIAGGTEGFNRDQIAISPTLVLNLGTGSGSGSGSGSAGS